MECACTVDVDIEFGDHMQLLSIGQHRANKEHMCNECRSTIKKGDWYHREVFKVDNDIDTHRTCEDCYSLRQVFFSSGWYYGQLWDDMEEFVAGCMGDISVECIRMLTPTARSKVLDIVERCWEDYYESQ